LLESGCDFLNLIGALEKGKVNCAAFLCGYQLRQFTRVNCRYAFLAIQALLCGILPLVLNAVANFRFRGICGLLN
jgi:hypothetical protein